MVINNPCTNGLINCNGELGKILVGLYSNIAGDWFVLFILVIALLITMALMFGIRLEYSAIIVMPLMLGLMILTKSFIGFSVLIFIYLSIIATTNFILR